MEHRDLTEQTSDDIAVLTGRPVRKKYLRLQGTRFNLKHIDQGRIFGIRAIWRAKRGNLVSEIHRRMVDIVDDRPWAEESGTLPTASRRSLPAITATTTRFSAMPHVSETLQCSSGSVSCRTSPRWRPVGRAPPGTSHQGSGHT